MRFGKKLSVLRKQHSMTQEQLAERLGISRQAVSRWERMTSDPSAENLIHIGRLFGVTVDSLMDDTMDVQPWKNGVTDYTVAEEGDDCSCKEENHMKKNLVAFYRYAYLAVTVAILVFERWLSSEYIHAPSVLTSKVVLFSMGPLFAFFLIMFLSLTVVHYTQQLKRHQSIVRASLVMTTALLWIVLCQLLQGSTLLVWGASPYVALLTAVCTIVWISQKKEG